jgi:hypothetical protein
MNSKQKWILSTLFFLFGATCLLVGGYFGAMLGSSVSESAILLSNQERYEQIYNCGMTGDIECFKSSYRDLAEFNIVHSSMLIKQDHSGGFSAELEEVKAQNERVLNEL